MYKRIDQNRWKILLYELVISFKNHPSLAPGGSLPNWFFGAIFAAMFVLNHRVIEFPLPAIANTFEL